MNDRQRQAFDNLRRELIEIESQSEHATKQDLSEMENRLMSKITDLMDAETLDIKALSTRIDQIAASAKAAADELAKLQALPGPPDASDQPALDRVQALLKTVLSQANAVVTTPPTITTP